MKQGGGEEEGIKKESINEIEEKRKIQKERNDKK